MEGTAFARRLRTQGSSLASTFMVIPNFGGQDGTLVEYRPFLGDLHKLRRALLLAPGFLALAAASFF